MEKAVLEKILHSICALRKDESKSGGGSQEEHSLHGPRGARGDHEVRSSS